MLVKHKDKVLDVLVNSELGTESEKAETEEAA